MGISRSWLSVYRGRNLPCPGWLYPGEPITIDYIDCYDYDVRIVDDIGTECINADIDFCFSGNIWVITNAFLDDCAFDA